MYRCDFWSGNADLDGRAGTVIGVDGTASPYTVEFDKELPDAMEDTRFGGKKGHCWCCTESHLIEETGGADDGSSDKSTNEKEKETMAREYVKWTDEEDAKLLSMKAEGKSHEEMAGEFHKTAEQCYNRLYYLQKVKGKYGVTDKTEPGAAEKAEATTQTEETPQEEQKGELNDLEKTMAETITEQKAEIDRLYGDVEDLESSLCKANEENTRLYDQIGSLTEKVASLESELQNTATALAQTETALDEEREAMRNVCAELEKAKAAEAEYQSMIEAYAIVKVELQNRLDENERNYTETLRGKDDRIAQLERENKRLLNLIVGLTEERLESHAS